MKQQIFSSNKSISLSGNSFNKALLNYAVRIIKPFAFLFLIFFSVFALSCNDDAVTPDAGNHNLPVLKGVWEKMRSAQGDSCYFISLHFSDSENGWITGSNGTVYYTSDGGEVWRKLNTGVSFVINDISFIDQRTGWLVGKNYLLSTVNGGESWNKQTIDTDSASILLKVIFKSPKDGWILSNSGKIFHSSDKGASWQIQKTYSPRCGAVIEFMDENNGFVIPMVNQKLIITQDGGRSWEEKKNNITFPYAVYFVTPQKGFLTTDYFLSSAMVFKTPLYMTNDGGNNWSVIDSMDFRSYKPITFADTLNGWIGTRNKIYATTDGGYKWFNQFTDSTNSDIFVDIGRVKREVWILDIHGIVYKYRM